MAMSGRSRGATITIFLVDGTPEGLRVTTKGGWTGACLDFARSDYARARLRDETEHSGIYVLVGPDPDTGTGRARLYVGEGDNVRARLDQHHKEKEFWNRAFLFTTVDDSLNKAHVRYLEAKLISLARGARVCSVDNNTEPPAKGLGEAEKDQMEAFLDEMLVLLPLLGVNGFTSVEGGPLTTLPPAPTTLSRTTAPSPTPTPAGTAAPYYLRERGRGVGTAPAEAEALDDARGFIVIEGATGPARDGGMSPGYEKLRKQLKADGTLIEEAGRVRLTRNYAFDSPSAAATMIVGSNRNGPATWKDHLGRTLAANRAATTADQA